MNARRTLGFTLVELLVVIAIIGILVALLLPAVQAARESARKAQCLGNFKQVGIACHNYVATLRTYPTGVNIWSAGGCNDPDGRTYSGFGWSAFILPYLEEDSIYEQMDFKLGGHAYATSPNYEAGANYIGAYICPSSPQGLELVVCCTGPYPGNGPNDSDMAVSNMAGVADSVNWACFQGGFYWPKPNANGMLFHRSAVRPAEVTDGTSKTLLVGEAINGPQGSHIGFFWSTWNILHTRNGINKTRPDNYVSPWFPAGMSFSSYHINGCHFTHADGSARFYSDNIHPTVLAAVTTRAMGEIYNDLGN